MPYFPFEELPTELLASIFEHGEISSRSLWDAGTDSWEISPFTTPFPILVSHVCRLWRQIAVDTATLWLKIHTFDFPQSSNSKLARLYLERSKSCPLDITFVHKYDAGNQSTQTRFMELLPSFGRWRVLTIITDDGEQMEQMLHLLEHIFPPLLETLQMSVIRPSFPIDDGRRAVRVPFELPIFLRGASRLHTVRLRNVPGFVQPAFANLVAVTLIMLDHEKYSFTRLRQFLDHVSQSLIYLRFELDELDTESRRNLRPVKLPVLRYLDIKFSPILSLISAPALEKLSLACLNATDLITIANHSPFTSLRHLVLVDMDLACLTHQPHFFATFPHLTSLTFVDCWKEWSLLKLLQHQSALGGGHVSRRNDRASVALVLPSLRALAISEMSNWPLVQSILAERLTEEGQGISRIGVPLDKGTMCILDHLRTWLGARDIELDLIDEGNSSRQFIYGEGEEEWENDMEQFAEYCEREACTSDDEW
jgi:F-box-like